MPSTTLPDALRGDVEVLWDFNRIDDAVQPVDVIIGLGGHDLGVADYTAELYHRNISKLIVFTGANAPTTKTLFPCGEAHHFRERALKLGVPDPAILVEPHATNTGDNIDFTRELLHERGLLDRIRSAMLISRPYQQRRSWAITRKRWPQIEILCSARQLPLEEYIAGIGDVDRVITMLVGDTQRLWVYPAKGWAAEVPIPAEVRAAYHRLVDAGYTGRLLAA